MRHAPPQRRPRAGQEQRVRREAVSHGQKPPMPVLLPVICPTIHAAENRTMIPDDGHKAVPSIEGVEHHRKANQRDGENGQAHYQECRLQGCEMLLINVMREPPDPVMVSC
jgi:hypothetical protein